MMDVLVEPKDKLFEVSNSYQIYIIINYIN